MRRFCEVLVKGDDVYIFQPARGGSLKTSYHKSGQQHLKIGSGAPIMPPMQLDPSSAIVTEENPWSKSCEDFATLLPYKRERADALCEIDLLSGAADITFVQICIGRSFDSTGWTMDGVDQLTLKQELFSVPQSPNGLQICVRVVRLQPST